MRRKLGLAIVLLLVMQLAVSCASSGTSPATSPTAASQQAAGTAGSRLLSAEELAGLLGQKDRLLVNVHVPYEGEIEGTDLFIPFDQIGSNLDKLPQDKDAEIVLYCRSGTMSADAARTLADLGYTNVLDLRGGMHAWKDAGYQIVERSR